MDVAVTKMSSKGQVVIPKEMREDINEGEKLVIIKNEHQFILEKVDDIGQSLAEDLIFAQRTEDALKKYEKGEFAQMDDKKFSEELDKW